MRAGKVVAFELDRALKPVLNETLSDCKNVEVVFEDILKQDIQSITEKHLPGLRPVACANLPYNITTPALTRLIDSGCFDTITVMVQREVARRICAAAGTPDYGAFTVYLNWHAEPEILFDVTPDCFMPQPKVISSVVRMKKRQSPPVEVESRELFFKVVRAAFSQRRKTLVNALKAVFSGA
jgi:16S rRNA (adenine1518-N6/adenine1519-N6)-dimethyltransferase